MLAQRVPYRHGGRCTLNREDVQRRGSPGHQCLNRGTQLKQLQLGCGRRSRAAAEVVPNAHGLVHNAAHKYQCKSWGDPCVDNSRTVPLGFRGRAGAWGL